MSVKVRGLEEAFRILRHDLPETARDLSREMVLDIAKEIAKRAAESAPVRTGVLRGSIKARNDPDDPDMSEVYVQRSGKKGDAFYWRFIEYGQGPGDIGTGFLLRAREAVLGGEGKFTAKYRRKMAKQLKGL
jgi:hypothetical protein